jgi:tRNA pseudouridine38-40 synthase
MFGAPLYIYRVEADAFLYRMVRAITGALMRVGQGRLGLEGFEAALRAARRDQIRALAPAHGLALVAVRYADTINADAASGGVE